LFGVLVTLGEVDRKRANRLINQKSPYLLQHAFNPVDWYPWGDEAFEKAKKENKPIFLSIGYSTCHWCHVMEKESFEDAEVARLLNEAFVCIKVDREERPDIDSVYMKICQMMTGSGGWPLTIVMTPDKKPFFAATYIPKNNRFGQVGLLELVPRLKDIWNSRGSEIAESAEQVVSALKDLDTESSRVELGKQTLENAYAQMYEAFDEEYGGFGGAPKFPTPHRLCFLLRYWRRNRDAGALYMVERTLAAMRMGGIYDHVGFGFHRYSTDREWLVPHFEKMIYDQALLVLAYCEAYQATRKEEYVSTIRETLEFVQRELLSPEGGFYTALDADSEGVEGKFYLWSLEELNQTLQGDDAKLASYIFNVSRVGNYPEAVGEKSGANILYLTKTVSDLASELGLTPEELGVRLQRIRGALFKARSRRVRPNRDDKMLADYNGLVVAALAKASTVLHDESYARAAEKAVEFVLSKMTSSKGGLYHSYRDGKASVPAFLDDYAFLTWGLLNLYEATFNAQYIREALRLTDTLLNHFWDVEKGGFYFTADFAEETLTRVKEAYDGAVPSGNSVSALNLIRLSRMTGVAEYEEKASRIMSAFSSTVARSPENFAQFLMALDFLMGSHEVVVVGRRKEKSTEAMLGLLGEIFVPNKVVLLREPEAEGDDVAFLAPFTKDMRQVHGEATAYVCRNFKCELPTTNPERVLETLITKDP
jgi:uncharacterized protein YyaL (SSP411 family)